MSDRLYAQWAATGPLTTADAVTEVNTQLSIAQIQSTDRIDAISVRRDVVAGGVSTAEYWTFIRSAGARRVTINADVTDCPNCGAPVQVSQAGPCTFCGTTVVRGRVDWLLDSIVPASEWQAAA